MSRFKSTLGSFLLAVSVFPVTATVPGSVQATSAWTPDATQSIITRVYFEGLPFEVAQKFPPAATAHLSAILEDPDLYPHHPNALLALGISGHPGSYEIISEYPLPREGELSRPAYHALVAQRIAMGHLGRHDERAVTWLVDRLKDTNPQPGFSYRVLQGARLARELRGQAAAALALSGSSRAQEVLEKLRQERRARVVPEATGLSLASVDAALADLERIRDMGPERALASPFSSTRPGQKSPR